MNEYLINGSYVPNNFLSMLHVLVHLTFIKNAAGAIIIPILQKGTGRLSDLLRVIYPTSHGKARIEAQVPGSRANCLTKT